MHSPRLYVNQVINKILLVTSKILQSKKKTENYAIFESAKIEKVLANIHVYSYLAILMRSVTTMKEPCQVNARSFSNFLIS